MEKEIGLIGFPLAHSFSPKWFGEYFATNHITNFSYKLFPLPEINQLPLLIRNHPNLIGLNVTIPHKQSVINYLDKVPPHAAMIGAVNCMKIERTHQQIVTTGYNTDCIGFLQSLKPLLKNEHHKALIFGNGGAAQAVKYALTQLNIQYLVVSRSLSNETTSYTSLNREILHSHKLWIHTTPLGMSQYADSCIDIDLSAITPQHLVYDLIYNPEETLLLRECKARGAQIKNGLEMLHLQALESAKIFGLENSH